MRAREILETCLYVADLAAARRFYHDLLGLELVEEQPDRHLFFRCGGRMLLVFLPDASSRTNGLLPPHGTHGPGHVAFAASLEELERWLAYLTEHQVAIEKDYRWPQGGRSLYFRDPAGNSVELATPNIWRLDECKTFGAEG